MLTDTIPVDAAGLRGLHVLLIAPLLAEAILRVRRDGSLSALFLRREQGMS